MILQDLGAKVCPKTKQPCQARCQGYYLKSESDPSWYSPTSIAQVAALIHANPEATYRFIAGDTGKGNGRAWMLFLCF